jgi:hypothetical protein
LSQNKTKISKAELQAILNLFYYGYITKNYHSYCEVHAAFLRASENYYYPELNTEDLLAPQEATAACQVLPYLRPHKKAFETLLTQVQDETIAIIEEEGIPQALKAAAKQLCHELNRAKQNFFENPTNESLVIFQGTCRDQINTAQKVFEAHLSTWEKFHPILKGILGILALILIIPALIIEARSSYTQTFFGKPTSKKLERLGKDMNLFFSNSHYPMGTEGMTTGALAKPPSPQNHSSHPR